MECALWDQEIYVGSEPTSERGVGTISLYIFSGPYQWYKELFTAGSCYGPIQRPAFGRPGPDRASCRSEFGWWDDAALETRLRDGSRGIQWGLQDKRHNRPALWYHDREALIRHQGPELALIRGRRLGPAELPAAAPTSRSGDGAAVTEHGGAASCRCPDQAWHFLSVADTARAATELTAPSRVANTNSGKEFPHMWSPSLRRCCLRPRRQEPLCPKHCCNGHCEQPWFSV